MLTWILVADEARARVFEDDGTGAALVERHSLIHAEGRQHGRDVFADRKPRTQESAGSARHAIEPHTDPEDVEAGRFARELAHLLEQARHARQFERLLLVAPPHFLGVLRRTIGDGVAALVVGSMSKDLTHEPADVIRQRIAGSA